MKMCVCCLALPAGKDGSKEGGWLFQLLVCFSCCCYTSTQVLVVDVHLFEDLKTWCSALSAM